METGAGAEEGRGNKTIFLLLSFPKQGYGHTTGRPGLCWAHAGKRSVASRGRLECPPPPSTSCFPGPRLSEVRIPDVLKACALGLPLWADALVGILQPPLALEGQGAEQGEGRGAVRQGFAPSGAPRQPPEGSRSTA